MRHPWAYLSAAGRVCLGQDTAFKEYSFTFSKFQAQGSWES